jgi:phosphate-selective porin OprO/OprP
MRPFVLGLAATALMPSFAFAGDNDAMMRRLDALQRMIEQQQREIEQQRAEIRSLRRELDRRALGPAQTAARSEASIGPTASSLPPASVATRINAQQAQRDALQDATQQARIAEHEQPVWSLANARPTINSPDGRFSLSVRALGPLDMAYYAQGNGIARRMPGGDLSSGSNLRRAQLGLQGKVLDDWGYFFNYEFGGSGTEGGGRVQSLYAEYTAFAPLTLRVGVFPPPGGLEDNTSSSDTIFLERAAPSDVLRNTVGGDGRHTISIIYATPVFYAAASLTGGRVGDAAVFDEQQALLGRIAGLVYNKGDTRIALSASGAYLYKVADTAAGANAARPLTFSAIPELSVDSTAARLVTTGAVDSQSATIWGIEGAAQWSSLYAQAGYFGYAIERRQSPLSDPEFSGWYLQASWLLTGEVRGYNLQNATFTQPKPRIIFAPDSGGWGAWEIAARYSNLEFNYREGHAGAAAPTDGIRGGEQSIWTAGLNWYPNSVIRFALDYQHIDIDRLGTVPAIGADLAIPNAEIGQTIHAVSLRSQVSF